MTQEIGLLYMGELSLADVSHIDYMELKQKAQAKKIWKKKQNGKTTLTRKKQQKQRKTEDEN